MSMLLDTIADPGPLEAGKVYRLDEGRGSGNDQV